ncbi:hypothetical protein [Mycoplasma sp. Mirounga ES2805-ORL]|uniref:hypothetical protein n=1 Tax=Mycoplasma sp. Mirounga ES2805-ORL TaxID=754514 RepID=UPI00197B9B65|nr:hypothetical protein [Mycoplasma sp. Mirounga ES2805-ORL]QSF13870.1 hypothetical protein JXZ90_01040 [Mycoplasma sp. Mirounga ES2805-ORL]
MVKIDRDPILCEQRIQKRREFLLQQYNENKEELLNPAIIHVDDHVKGECQELHCLAKSEELSPQELKRMKIYKYLQLGTSILVILSCILAAVLIGRLGGK